MKSKPALTAFRHSRIYAEGWNAARTLAASDPHTGVEPATPNPYASEPERSRWHEGFSAALV
jgi:hypothetical protein